jgi:hypothetical protein
MSLLLMTDHLIADLQDKFVVRVELIELRTSGGLSLKDPKVAFGIQGDGRDTARARRQNIGVGKRIAQRLFPLYSLE